MDDNSGILSPIDRPKSHKNENAEPLANTRVEQFLQHELQHNITSHLKQGPIFSIACAIMLFLACNGSYDKAMVLWLETAVIACLALQLMIGLKIRQHLFVVTSLLVNSLLWGLAGPVFILSNHPSNAIAVAAAVTVMTALWPMLHTLPSVWCRGFLLSLYIPLGITSVVGYPHYSSGIIVALTAVCIMLHISWGANYRTLAEIAKSAIRSKNRADRIIHDNEKIAQFIALSPLGIVEWNHRRIINAWNPAAERIFNISSIEALGRSVDSLFEGRKIVLINPEKQGQLPFDIEISDLELSDEIEGIINDRSATICEWNEIPICENDINTTGSAAFVRDVTDRVQAHTNIKRQAYFDPLTGLPNRRRLMEELERVCALAQRTKKFCALLFIDLDQFKAINDLHGHHYGDLALTLFAQRVRKVIRKQEMVARLGGDEFVVVLEDLGTEGQEQAKQKVSPVAEKIIATTREQFILKGQTFQIDCSIGIILFNNGDSDTSSLLEKADQALYMIKDDNKSNYYFYDPNVTAAVGKQQNWGQSNINLDLQTPG